MNKYRSVSAAGSTSTEIQTDLLSRLWLKSVATEGLLSFSMRKSGCQEKEKEVKSKKKSKIWDICMIVVSL